MSSSVVVMKFGGTSVKNSERFMRAAKQIAFNRKKGHKVAVVVSAPGDMTDDLIARAEGITQDPEGREMDMLLATGEQVSIALMCMALKTLGVKALSLTGPQAGIHADEMHTKARIRTIRPVKIENAFKNGNVVVVAGFQGLNRNEDVVTLGRGGSDLTAVALAAALKASACEIYTDVPGVFTADPRVVPGANKIDQISYDEMLELAGSGSQVMQSRSIEVAKKFGVKIHVRSSIETKKKGTFITKALNDMEASVVSGIAYEKNEAKVAISGVPDRPGIAASIFEALAKEAINVDMIIQSAAEDGLNDIAFTVQRGDLKKTLRVLEPVKKRLHADHIATDDKVVKISIVGLGMKGHSGVAAKMFTTLASHKINIEMISTSEIKISVVVNESDGVRTLRILHKAFGLGN